MKPIIYDIECYKNFFLVCFKIDENKYLAIQKHNGIVKGFTIENGKKKQVDNFLKFLMFALTNRTLIGFNSSNYDIHILSYFLSERTNEEMKKLSDCLILNTDNEFTWQIANKMFVERLQSVDHIDIMPLASNSKVKLKTYGARLNAPKLQNLPINPSSLIEEKDIDTLIQYCINDLDITELLFNELKQPMLIRERVKKAYNIDVSSCSEPKIAEKVFNKILSLPYGESVPPSKVKFKSSLKYPINFSTQILKDLHNKILTHDYVVSNNKKQKGHGKPISLETIVKVQDTEYKVAIGGLHSQEKRISKFTNDEYQIECLDVTSYYPSLILNFDFYPQKCGSDFSKIYTSFYKDRIVNKKNNNKLVSDILKLLLNSCFGKFGSVYSNFYDPELLVNITLNGQLILLKLIEDLYLNDIEVFSGNTDGVFVRYKKDKVSIFEKTIKQWQEHFNLSLSRAKCEKIFMESVNSYVCFYEDGAITLKGDIAYNSYHKNSTAKVVSHCVIETLKNHNFDIEQYLQKNNNIEDYCFFTTVNGGAKYKEEQIGSVVRWVHIDTDECIKRNSNNGRVSNTSRSYPVMDFTSPDNKNIVLDKEQYLNKIIKKLKTFNYEYDRK